MELRPSILLSVCIVLVAIGSAGVGATQPAVESTVDRPSLSAADSTAVSSSHSAPDEANASFPVTLTDATGTAVTMTEPPERVTTTAPSAAQVLWELGAAEQVVGVTQFAHYLSGADSRANVSSTDFGVSIERVVATEPDLVVAPNATSVETVDALREAGLTVYYFPEATDFEDVKAKTLTIGQLTGNEQAARETNAWVEANVEAVSASTADRERPKLLYPLLGGFAVGSETFIHEIILASGADNVAAAEFDGYQVLNDETVITLDPAVLLVTDQTEGQIRGSEPYSLTTAGETNRTVFLAVNYINQPAPRSIVYSTRNLTAQLHPGVYNESDFVTRAEAAARLDGSTDVSDDTGNTESSSDSNETESSDDTNGTETSSDSGSTAESTTAEGDEGDETNISAPGFGLTAAVLSLLGGGLLARRRARSEQF